MTPVGEDVEQAEQRHAANGDEQKGHCAQVGQAIENHHQVACHKEERDERRHPGPHPVPDDDCDKQRRGKQEDLACDHERRVRSLVQPKLLERLDLAGTQ